MIKSRISSPCKDCKSRYLGCHDECVDYIKYKDKSNKIKEALYKGKERENMINSYEVECARRVIKKQGGKIKW